MEQATRVALITGGAKRVGRAIVEHFAEQGWDVAFSYLTSEDEAKAVCERAQALGRRAVAIRADLTQPESAAAEIANGFRNTFQRIDALVNNASLYLPDSLPQASLQNLRKMMAIHVESPILLCQRFAEDLRRTRGHIVNMVDLLAERPLPKYLTYCATKAALLNLTLNLARELAPDVTVNGIAPGAVEWPEDYPEEQRAKYLRRVPLGRVGTAREVAELVYFLCKEGAYITGQIVRLDGGRSIT